MEPNPSWMTALGPLLASLVTGASTLLGVVLAQRSSRRQQEERDREAAGDKVEVVVAELTRATLAFHADLLLRQQRWNSWGPRLLHLGRTVLEFQAGRQSRAGFLGALDGMGRAAGVSLDWHERSMAATETFVGESFEQFTAAASRAVLLPDEDLVDAVARLVEAANAAATAYGADNLYQRRAAEAGRRAADTALHEALGAVTRAARERLSPPVSARRRWWPRGRR